MKVHNTQPLLPPVILLCLCAWALPAAEAQDSASSVATQAAAAEAKGQSSAESIEAAFQFVLAKMLVEESSYREAEDAFESSLELDDSDPYSFLEAAKFHSEMAGYSRSAERRRHQLIEAAELAGEASKRAPENLDVLFQFAQIHFRLGEYQAGSLEIARESLEKLRGLRDGDIQTLITLGQIYFMKREPDKAADVLKEAATFLPNHRMLQNMLVDALFGAGRTEEGEVALAKLVEIDPANLDERLRLAEMRRENSNPRGAAEVLRSAPPEVRKDPRLRQALAQALFLIGENQPALELTEKLIDELAEPAEMKRLRASIFVAMARYHDAIEAFRQLIRSGNEAGRRLQDSLFLGRLLERVGRSDEAIDILRSLVDSTSEKSPSLQLELALAGTLERADRSDEAVAMLEASLSRAGTEEWGVYGAALSEILNDADRPDEALEVLARTSLRLREVGKGDALAGLDLRKLGILAARQRWREVVDWAPELLRHENADLRAAAVRLQARGLAELGQVEAALESLDDSRFMGTRIEILFDQGRQQEAQSQLDKLAASGKPGDLLFVARLYQQVERYEPVIRWMTRLLESEPETQPALFILAAAQERQGQRPESIATFRRLLAIEPDHAPALNYLGYMMSETGENLDEALGFILRAVALDPDNGAYVDSLGWVLYRLERYDEAEQHLEWAARLVPTDPTIFEHLGDLHIRREQLLLAREAYQKAIDLGGDQVEQVRLKLDRLLEKAP